MNKTLLATSMALALGASTSANAAFTALSDGDYQMTITGGCFDFGNCVANGTGAFADNTAGQTQISVTFTYGAISPGVYGSGIAGDGVMGVIDFTLTGGSMAVSSFSQDSYLNTAGGTFYLDAGNGGVGGMGGSIDGSGNMVFDPTGRRGLAAGFATSLGAQPWNIDNPSTGTGTGLYDTWTTGTSTNNNKGLTPGFTLTGSALQDAGVGMWTGTMVSAGNIGTAWGSFDNTQFSELFNVTITSTGTPEVPVPAAVWLFGSGLVGLVGVARRRRKA